MGKRRKKRTAAAAGAPEEEQVRGFLRQVRRVRHVTARHLPEG